MAGKKKEAAAAPAAPPAAAESGGKKRKAAETAAVTIYHNPRCSKSRESLKHLQEQKIDPKVVLYLDDTPGREELEGIYKMLGLSSPRDMMRKGEKEYKDVRSDTLSDSELFEAMVATPKLIERPIVVSGGKAVIGRPLGNVVSLLEGECKKARSA